ncbi:START domain-containing protein [Arcticibacter eurypsychrophilus]|uniref:START domain-containing protein n=1 Tax=Arcticibacter eurypsychrophilus TaxID=1434752 RepID=UPI0009F4B012|nr:START domain-containing protein [Arcticibacter eurypsychrophilus]
MMVPIYDYKYRNLVIFLLLLLPIADAFAQSPWKLNTEKDGIRVFSRTVPDSKVKALKIECVLKTTLSQLVTLLLDVNETDQWVYHTKTCVLVRKVSPSDIYYYAEVSLPWPMENRDFVVHIRVFQNPQTKIVTIDAPSVSDIVPVKKGIVRISHSKGFWKIIPLDQNLVKVEYSLQVDPGGIIPAWMVNTFAAQGPLQSFRNMKGQLTHPKYRNATLPFIVNW